MGWDTRDVRKPPFPWWVVWVLVPFGWTSWIGFIQGGRRIKRPYWYGFAAIYLAATVVEFSMHSSDAVGAIAAVAWIVGIGNALVLLPGWRRREALLEDPAMRSARAEEDRRRFAIELAHKDPQLASAAQLGRRGGFDEGGVIDVNHAAVEELADLPEITAALARQIVTVREQVHGFSSLEDLGMTLDLPGNVVEDLRGRVVFLPR